MRPAFHSLKLGKLLSEHILIRQSQSGYRFMRLDTRREQMHRAIAIYSSCLDFTEIPPYSKIHSDIYYMECDLTR